MEKITFNIPGIKEEYHVPLLNFDSQDKLLGIAPRFFGKLGDIKFDSVDSAGNKVIPTENLITLFLQLVTTGAIFKKLASSVMCPAKRDYYIESDYEDNLKIAGRLPATYLIEGFADKDGKAEMKSGVLLRSFLASNSNWLAGLANLTSLFQSEAKQEEESDTDSQDSPTPDGEASTD